MIKLGYSSGGIDEYSSVFEMSISSYGVFWPCVYAHGSVHVGVASSQP